MFHILLKPTTNNNKTTYSYINNILIVSEREREREREVGKERSVAEKLRALLKISLTIASVLEFLLR